MLNLKSLTREWSELTSYQRFEHVASRVVMAFIAAIIVYSIILAGIELVGDFLLGAKYVEQQRLQEVFGSILTILILLEFNHSIAIALAQRTGIIQARFVVLIAILVIARKIILLDFTSATIETLGGHAGVALALRLLYWLIASANREHRPPPRGEATPPQRGR